MKIKRHQASVPRAKRPHLVGIVAILMALAGLAFFALHSIQSKEAEGRAEQAQKLQERGKRVQQLFSAEEEKLHSLLLRVRSDLRSDGHWARESVRAGPRELTAEAPPASVDAEGLLPGASSEGVSANEVAVRLGADARGDRWRAVRADLKRGLTDRADLLALEVVVADQAGLTAIRVARSTAGFEEEVEDPRGAKGVAKAIWYADEVRRAVAASGRKLTRGEFYPTGRGEAQRMAMRVALGLHDPSELVQGVLVATLDFSGIADAVVGAADSGIQLRLVTLEGQTLNSVAPGEATRQSVPAHGVGVGVGGDRDAALVARILSPNHDAKAFAADDYLVDGFALSQGDGQKSEAVLLMETPLAPRDLLSRASSAWGIALLVSCLVAAVAIFGLMRWAKRRGSDSKEMDSAQTPKRPEAAAEEAAGEIRVADVSGAMAEAETSREASGVLLAHERIVLRDWLGDVRGCLERDAAIRGLSLTLRCERSLPRCIDQDPGWLGGLLIAMGQEALDATSEDRVFVQVREDAHEVLRFEVDAGPVDLQPVRGMLAIAEKLGGHFETEPSGGLAFLVPLGPS